MKSLINDLAKARKHANAIEKLLNPYGEKLAEILGDECVHICDQPGDGYVITFNGGFDNSHLASIGKSINLDNLLFLDKGALLLLLNLHSI